MALTIPTWDRPNYTPTRAEAFVDYIVFGQFNLSVPIDRQKYRSARRPIGSELLQYDRAASAEAFETIFATAEWKIAAADQPHLAGLALDALQMIRLQAHLPDPENLNYLRDSIGIVAYLLDRGGVVVFDPQILQLWSAGQWQEEIFAPARPQPHRHVVIVRTPQGPGSDLEWIHTRGMKLFARHDLAVYHVGKHYQNPIVELFNLYIDYQARGGEILAGDVVTLDGLPPDGTCHLDGRLDHPDYRNSHVEILWPDGQLTT